MPNKGLFNQKLKAKVSLTDRMAFGIPGMEGCDNMTVSNFLKETGGCLVQRLYNKTSQEVITIPQNSKILDFDLFSSGSATAKVTMDEDGDIVSETTFSGALPNYINKYIPYGSSKTFTVDVISGTISIIVRYIPNCY